MAAGFAVTARPLPVKTAGHDLGINLPAAATDRKTFPGMTSEFIDDEDL